MKIVIFENCFEKCTVNENRGSARKGKRRLGFTGKAREMDSA
jgi:hypothetical protein